MSILDLVKQKKNEIKSIASMNGVTRIALFGSVARGQDETSSDIDFLVEFEESRSLFDLIRLKHDLENLLCKSVDVVTRNSVHPLIRDSILNQAVNL